MKGDIVLSQREAHRAKIFGEVGTGAMTLREAAVALKISYRHTRRVYRRFRDEGVAGLAHRRRGTPASNAIDPDLRTRILQLHDQAYDDFNDTHFTEMLDEHDDISVSRETVRCILRAAGKPPKRKRRPSKHRSRRPRKPKAGIMMQWDGSPHSWFGHDRPPCCLMSAIDDADSRLLGALFVPHESAVGYLRLLDMVIRRHGAPVSVYQDRHSIHERPDDHWSIEEEIMGVRFPTHMGRVLKDLGIAPIPAHSPQAKGRIERSFGVLQDRLIA
jgi:transposase